MSYSFTYTVTAKCYRMKDALGLPSGILLYWRRFGQGQPSFIVDSNGWLSCSDGSEALGGLYDTTAVELMDYSVTVPVIIPQLKSGAVGIAFRVADASNYYCFLLDDGALGWQQNTRLIKVTNNTPRVLAETNVPVRSGDFVLIKVTLVSNRIRIEANGSVVFDYTDTDTPILNGSYGVATIKGSGVRFAGVYREAVLQTDVEASFTGTLDTSATGLANSQPVSSTTVYNMMKPYVDQRAAALGAAQDEFIVYAYTVRAADIFVQPYFKLSEPVVYTTTGNCYVWAYLKSTPRPPEVPTNFKGTVKNGYIEWTWNDVSAIETSYFVYNASGVRIAALPANTTLYTEPITDDGITVTRRLTAANNVGESQPVEASVFVPIQTPYPPSSFEGQALNISSIKWVWSSVGLADSYELIDEQGNVIAILPQGVTSYIEEGLLPGTLYTRGIRAMRKGTASPVVYASAETFGAAGLVNIEIPVLFEGTALSPRVVRWTWDHYGTVSGFILYDTAGTEIARLSADSRDYIEYNLEPGKTYTRILVAIDRRGYKSAPVMASVTLSDEFSEIECNVYTEDTPRFIPGFSSGIGDGTDLETFIKPAQPEAVVITRAVKRVEEVKEVPGSAKCAVRFGARGIEMAERDYGAYSLDLKLQPGADVDVSVSAEVYEPIPARWKVNGSVRYAEFVDQQFTYDLKVTYQDSSVIAPADIIWIIDVSGSMDDDVANIASNAQLFTDTLTQKNIDYRLGVVKYLADAKKVLYNGKDWATDSASFQAMVQSTVSVTSGEENGINAINFALTNYQFRDGAVKYFVLVSDEGARDMGSYDIPALISSLKASGVILTGIINPNDCNPYSQIAQETGGITLNITNSDWGSNLIAVVEDIRRSVIKTGTIPSLIGTAKGGFEYQPADAKTVDQIIADYIAQGGTELPQDFLTADYYTIQGYEVVIKSGSNVYAEVHGDMVVAKSGQVTVSTVPLSTSEFSIAELDRTASQSNPQGVDSSVSVSPPHAFHVKGYIDWTVSEKVDAKSDTVQKSSGCYLSPDGKVVWMRPLSYAQATFSVPSTSVAVQFRGSDHNDGFAVIYVDDVKVGEFYTKDTGDNFVLIWGLSSTVHTVRVESVYGDVHLDFFAGLNNVTPAAVSKLEALVSPNSYHLFEQVEVVSLDERSAVYAVNCGVSPIYAYPLVPFTTTTTWHFDDTVYKRDGLKVIADTAQLQPLGRDGNVYTGSDVTWKLTVNSITEGATVRWLNSASDTASTGDRVVASYEAELVKSFQGWASRAYPTSIGARAAFPDIDRYSKFVIVAELNGDPNVYAELSPAGIEIWSGSMAEFAAADGYVTVLAESYAVPRKRTWRGPYKVIDICGTAELPVDLVLPDSAQVSEYFFEVDNPAVDARFKNSGGSTTTDKDDVLVLSYDKTVVVKSYTELYGPPAVQKVKLPSAEEPIKLIGFKPNWEADSYACLPLGAGIEIRVNRVADIPGTPFVAIDATAVVDAPEAHKWIPTSKNGFYYVNGEERFLYGRSDVSGSESGVPLIPVYAEVRAVISTGEAAEERSMAFCGTVPADGEWHRLLDDICLDAFIKYGLISSDETERISEFAVGRVYPEGVALVRCSSGGTGYIEACIVRGIVSRNTAFLGDNMTAVVYPTPQGLAPVTAMLQDGTPLKYVRFKNGDDYFSLDCVETIRGFGEQYVYLAYPDIDPDTVSIRFKPDRSERWFSISRFRLCANMLILPVRVLKYDIVEVSYRVMDSFTIDPTAPEGGATIKVHSKKAKPGDPVIVHYETSHDGLHAWDEVSLNPLDLYISKGFLKIKRTDVELGAKRLVINIAPSAVTPGRDREAYIHIHACYADGSPAAGTTIDITTRNGVSTVTTDLGGNASLYLPLWEIEGGISVSCDTGTVNINIPVTDAAPTAVCIAEVDSDKLEPGWSTNVKVRVLKNGLPVSGARVVVTSDCGTIEQPFGVTNPYGEFVTKYTASNTQNVRDIIRATSPDNLFEEAVAAVFIGGDAPISGIVNNRIQDLSDSLTIDDCARYTIDTLATTPPELL